MSSFLSKIAVNIAKQQKKNKFDLSTTLVTTQDFYNMKPVYIKEVMPDEEIKINYASFTRLSPISEPLYGHMEQVTRAFFVPMRTVMEGWNEFITQTPYKAATVGGSTPVMITATTQITNSEIIRMFCEYSGNKSGSDLYVLNTELNVPKDYLWNEKPALTWGVDATSAAAGDITYDFYITSDYSWISSVDPQTQYYKLTPFGKIVWNILLGLGYKLNTQFNDTTSMSALPLMAYAKLFIDWYANPAYAEVSSLEGLFKYYNQSISYSTAYTIFTNIYNICYSEDYFTSAWDNPTSPNSTNIEGSIRINDVTSNGSNSSSVSNYTVVSGQSGTNGTPYLHGVYGSSNTGSSSLYNVSQYAIDALKKVTDYVKRHQLVGSRALDRYMAQFGIQLESEKLNRSVYLGGKRDAIEISDVMQTTPDTSEGTSLDTGVGAYSGKGIGVSQNYIEFKSDEFGYLIITSYIEPKTSYVDGRPRMLQHSTPLDFFNGDFDGLGVQAIRQDELIANGYSAINTTAGGTNRLTPSAVFGYTPRYAEYKTTQDNMTGDFSLNSLNPQLEGWYLYRDYSGDMVNITDTSLPIKHNLAFTQGKQQLYDYVFADQNIYADHFFTIFRFNVESWMPAKKLFDNYEFDSEGKTLMMDINGTQITS